MLNNIILDILTTSQAMNILIVAQDQNIFGILSKQSMTANEVSSHIGAQLKNTSSFLDACVALGLLRFSCGHYFNSHIAEVHLIKERPRYLGDLIKLKAAEVISWQDMRDFILDNKQPFQKGLSVSNLDFTLAMNNIGMLGEAEALANVVPIKSKAVMADVGCGSGVYSIALCRNNPGLHAILIDKKEILKYTKKFILESNLLTRVSFQAKNIKKDLYGKGLDLVLISDVLYDNSDLNAAMLKLAYKSLAPDGLIVLRGYYSDPDRSLPIHGALFNLSMLMHEPLSEVLSIPSLKHIIQDAGFKKTKVIAITERSSCLIAWK